MQRNILFLATLAGFIGGGLFSLMFAGWTAMADGDPTTDGLPRVLPYEGAVELDGVTYSGGLDIRFTLYDESDAPLWSEAHSVDGDSGAQVAVYSGVFSVLLGRYVPIEQTVLDAEPLYVGLELRRNDDGTAGSDDWVELTGRQQLGMAPFAMWSSASTDLTVASSLSIGGVTATPGGPNAEDLTFSNATNGGVMTLEADGDLVIDGGLNASGGGITVGGCVVFPQSSAGDAEVAMCDRDPLFPDDGISVRATTALSDGDSIFRVLSPGGAERLRVEHNGNVEITNSLTVSGSIRANGDAYVEDLILENDHSISGVDVINGYNDIRFDADGNGVLDLVIDAAGFLIFQHWLDGTTFSSHDGNAQLVTIASTTCTDGAIRPSLIDGDQPGICICARGSGLSHGPGWYCLK